MSADSVYSVLDRADDFAYEEDVARNPYSIRHWWVYIQAKRESPAKVGGARAWAVNPPPHPHPPSRTAGGTVGLPPPAHPAAPSAPAPLRVMPPGVRRRRSACSCTSAR